MATWHAVAKSTRKYNRNNKGDWQGKACGGGLRGQGPAASCPIFFLSRALQLLAKPYGLRGFL
jgi:hypothetical protein